MLSPYDMLNNSIMTYSNVTIRSSYLVYTTYIVCMLYYIYYLKVCYLKVLYKLYYFK